MSVINVRDVVASIREVVDDVTVGVTVVGFVTLLAGALVLIGAVAMTKFQRLYEAAVYRTLGAGTRLVTAMVAVEYGLLGILPGLLAAIGAAGLSWVLVRHLLEIEWRPAFAMLSGASWRRRRSSALWASSQVWTSSSGNRSAHCGASRGKAVSRCQETSLSRSGPGSR
ncbi:MAG: hypothetical protein IT184_03125 [Acidobacteria bacterium]|nr:hypothetical protein [Acidobacteriota bacterium]